MGMTRRFDSARRTRKIGSKTYLPRFRSKNSRRRLRRSKENKKSTKTSKDLSDSYKR
jgi:hypothetical protein